MFTKSFLLDIPSSSFIGLKSVPLSQSRVDYRNSVLASVPKRVTDAVLLASSLLESAAPDLGYRQVQ